LQSNGGDKQRHYLPIGVYANKVGIDPSVSTATVERAFSAMKIVKSRLRSRMCDPFLNDCLVCYIEKNVFNTISNDSIMYRFQKMKNRKGQL